MRSARKPSTRTQRRSSRTAARGRWEIDGRNPEQPIGVPPYETRNLVVADERAVAAPTTRR